MKLIDIHETMGLKDYASVAKLAAHVQDLREEAQMIAPVLQGRKIWMVNSTAQGGGVAEMLPKMVSLLRELGVQCEWAVLTADEPEFFSFTKKIHNMIHGSGGTSLDGGQKELYEAVNRRNAQELQQLVRADDIVVIHDPQPLPLGVMLKEKTGACTIWRCHIGLDEDLPATQAVWSFLKPYVTDYNLCVFSAPEYIPDYVTSHVSVIHPALDPLSHKNRDLSSHKTVGILCNSGLAIDHHPVLTPSFNRSAERLQPDGKFAPANWPEAPGLLYRPVATQVSRWDRLKGFAPLLQGFVRLKEQLSDGKSHIDGRHRRRLELVRLILAGPEPASIQDDPEGQEVLTELCELYCKLAPHLQRDIVLLSLPMSSRKENALMVNVLQRCSTIVVQNSLREGFGLTATEAMWKHVPVLGTRACGLRQQVRDHLDGRLVSGPEDPEEVAKTLNDMLADEPGRDRMGRSGQRRVHDEFLVFTQLTRWLRLLCECAAC